MKPTEKQIKEFWEWCGFEPYIDRYYYDEPPRTLNGWIRDGEPPERFLPKIDLNSLFKYAVPRLLDELTEGEIHTLLSSWLRNFLPDRWIEQEYSDPALALFWAIWEVIKEERDEDTI